MKYVIVLGFVAVLVGVYAFNSLFSVDELTGDSDAQSAEEQSEQNTDTAAMSEAELSGTETIDALRMRSTDLECTITYESEEGDVEGTLFTSDGQLRGDFLVPSPDMTGQMLTSMILNGEQMTIWTEWEGEAQGMRVNLAELEGQSANEPVSRNEPVTYDCEPWSPVDRSVFNEPNDVLIYDFGDIMNAGMEDAMLYEGAEMP